MDLKLLKEALAKKYTFDVDGMEVVLQMPSIEKAKALRRRLVKSRNVSDSKSADVVFDMCAGSVEACVPGLNLDQASQLVLLSGGEMSPLSVKAQSLCGLDALLQKAQRVGDLDSPT